MFCDIRQLCHVSKGQEHNFTKTKVVLNKGMALEEQIIFKINDI